MPGADEYVLLCFVVTFVVIVHQSVAFLDSRAEPFAAGNGAFPFFVTVLLVLWLALHGLMLWRVRAILELRDRFWKAPDDSAWLGPLRTMADAGDRARAETALAQHLRDAGLQARVVRIWDGTSARARVQSTEEYRHDNTFAVVRFDSERTLSSALAAYEEHCTSSAALKAIADDFGKDAGTPHAPGVTMEALNPSWARLAEARGAKPQAMVSA